MARPRKNITLNFEAITNALVTGSTKVDLKQIAAAHSTCPPVIRRILSEYYGDKISFKPGRNGGVQWNATRNPNTAPVAATEPVSVA